MCSLFESTTAADGSKINGEEARHFNDKIQMDVLFIGLERNRRATILLMEDVATRFGAARLLKHEPGPHIVRALERAWFRPYGPPKELQIDESRPFCSQ